MKTRLFIIAVASLLCLLAAGSTAQSSLFCLGKVCGL